MTAYQLNLLLSFARKYRVEFIRHTGQVGDPQPEQAVEATILALLAQADIARQAEAFALAKGLIRLAEEDCNGHRRHFFTH